MLLCVSRDVCECRVKNVISQQYKRHTRVLLFRCEATMVDAQCT